MATVSSEEMKVFADLILDNIRQEFQARHLSGNLMNTMYIEYDGQTPRIVIPAKTYNMLLYMKSGVVVHTSHGSYASKLNKTGSEFFSYPGSTRKGSTRQSPHNHIGFVQRAIDSALEQWIAMTGGKYSVKGKTEV